MSKFVLFCFKSFPLGFAVLLSGCSFFNFGLGNNSSSVTSVTVEEKFTMITLHDGDYSQQFSVQIGKIAQITELTKQNYYSLGYFDQEENGTKYFNADGSSTQVWSENLPTDFYVNYAPIEQFIHKEENLEYEFGWRAAHVMSLDAEFMNAVKSNLSRNLNINVSFYGYDSTSGNDWVVYYKNVSTYNEGSLNKTQILARYPGKKIILSSTFEYESFEVTYESKSIYGGENLTCFFDRSNMSGTGKVKNLAFEITFN